MGRKAIAVGDGQVSVQGYGWSSCAADSPPGDGRRLASTGERIRGAASSAGAKAAVCLRHELAVITTM